MNDKEKMALNYENPSKNKKATLVQTFSIGIFFLSKIDQLINGSCVLSNSHSCGLDALPYSLHALSL